MNAVIIALAALKEGGTLAAKFPMIGPIAGLILQALEMHDVSIRLFSWASFLLTDAWLGG